MSVQSRVPTIHDIWAIDHRLASVQAEPGFVLRLKYSDGEEYRVDLSDFVGTGGLSDAMANPGFFAEVRLGEDGDWVEWPNGLDIGADTLRWDGELARRGLTRADVA